MNGDKENGNVVGKFIPVNFTTQGKWEDSLKDTPASLMERGPGRLHLLRTLSCRQHPSPKGTLAPGPSQGVPQTRGKEVIPILQRSFQKATSPLLLGVVTLRPVGGVGHNAGRASLPNTEEHTLTTPPEAPGPHVRKGRRTRH